MLIWQYSKLAWHSATKPDSESEKATCACHQSKSRRKIYHFLTSDSCSSQTFWKIFNDTARRMAFSRLSVRISRCCLQLFKEPWTQKYGQMEFNSATRSIQSGCVTDQNRITDQKWMHLCRACLSTWTMPIICNETERFTTSVTIVFYFWFFFSFLWNDDWLRLHRFSLFTINVVVISMWILVSLFAISLIMI